MEKTDNYVMTYNLCWAGDKNGTLVERHFDPRPQKCRAFADGRREGKEQLGAADSMKLLEEAAKQIEGKKNETE